MDQFLKFYEGENHVSFCMKNDADFYNDVLTFLDSPDPSPAFKAFLQ